MFQCAGHTLLSPTSTSHSGEEAPRNLALHGEILYLLLFPALTLPSALFLHHRPVSDIGILPFLTIPYSLDLIQIWLLRLNC